jgi:hypothetical protein
MDAVSLLRDVDLLAASSGVTLNPEQRASIRPSLEILKQEKGFNSVLLWGKLLGDAGEYVIAEGVGFPPEGKVERNKVAGSEPVVTEYFDSVKDIPRQFFRLGADSVSWVPLPAITPELLQKVADFETDLRRVGNIFVPLSGSASNKFAYKVIIPPPPKKIKEPVVVPEGEEAPPPEPEEEEKGPEIIDKELVEDERLAHLIAQINFATAVVPRGAYILNSSRQVVKNPYFSGIERADALDLKHYQHLRRPAARQYVPPLKLQPISGVKLMAPTGTSPRPIAPPWTSTRTSLTRLTWTIPAAAGPPSSTTPTMSSRYALCFTRYLPLEVITVFYLSSH